ncbi:unnamed protein product [Rangifer tarandus platyrhynchus]|uniref:Uncharacterized protein n=2 Tax=Rangifer tarandus platyrhynchus TaxID=3082113 RepID=A0ABN8YCM6_RANTA|nr:unnamed protein product [Rangifer tarandus platyrhynchus]CAI9699668.1 unnamed protein product [Rangifer tarandus platyrhynchus]
MAANQAGAAPPTRTPTGGASLQRRDCSDHVEDCPKAPNWRAEDGMSLSSTEHLHEAPSLRQQCNSSTQDTEVNERIRHKEETEEYFPDGGKEKAPEELREAEINHLPNNEFKVIKMLSGLGRRMDEHSQKFNEESENIKKC